MFRKSKKIMIYAAALISMFGSFVFTSFDSKASIPEFYLTYPEPTSDESSGYITLLLQDNSTGQYKVNTWFWNCYADANSGEESPCNAIIDMTASTFNFTVGGFSGAQMATYNLFCITNGGNYQHRASSYTQPYIYSYSNDTIVGMKFKGNVASVHLSSSNNDFLVNFNQDGTALLLQGQMSLMFDMYYQDSYMIEKIIEVINNTDSLEDKLDTLIDIQATVRDEVQESNNWLKKIFEWLESSQEQEKEAASDQANTSLESGQSSIEDKGQGFIDALGSFKSTIAVNDTNAFWTFPALYLPEIPGVMSRVQLTSEQKIDFTYWVNQIPSDILLLIQSVCTMCLIVYCFKEFYGVIEYVLTLRGGSTNE